MNIEEYNYLWTSQKDSYVLVSTEFGFGIVNKKNQTVLSFSDETLEDAIIKKMMDEGCNVYQNIQDAYADI